MATMSLQAAYDQTRRWIESNDSERAIGLAKHILSQYPDNLEAFRILGEAYLANRQLDLAHDAFERVLQADPENIPAHVGLGITYERQGKLDKAVPEFEQAWEIKPDMPELRSQLLRLYTEAWGNEHAQLRLSRAGLARLYAKGHMLPQAITEFRQVINEQPNRLDAKVALVEALWREGQEEDAASMARQLLADYPNALKPSLLLGYMSLATGKPEGKTYWDKAAAMDPYYTVAKAMFDPLPEIADQEPTLTEWDEAEWRAQRLAAQQKEISATRPIPVAAPVAEQPVPDVEEPAQQDDDFFSGSWLNTEPAQVAQQSAVVSNASPPEDDFLAGLLAMGAGASDASSARVSPAPSPAAETPLDQIEGFSLDDIDVSAADTRAGGSNQDVAASSPDLPWVDATPSWALPTRSRETPAYNDAVNIDSQDAESDMQPLNAIGEPNDTPAPFNDEPELEPFSLSELGLSDEEIDAFNLPEQPTTSTTPAAAEDDIESMQPFSLSELGLSDEEIKALNDIGSSTPDDAQSLDQSDISTMQPFTLSELGLDDEQGTPPENQTPTATNTPDNTDGNIGDLQPFSLSELGLSDEEIRSLNSFGTDAPEAEGDPDVSGDVKPFSLDELDLNAGFEDDLNSGQSFSFNTPETPSGTSSPDRTQQPESSRSGFNWSNTPLRANTSWSQPPREEPADEGLSIFAKLKQRKQTEGDEQTEQPVRTSSNNPYEHFSLDDISLRDDDSNLQYPAEEAADEHATLSLPEDQPASSVEDTTAQVVLPTEVPTIETQQDNNHLAPDDLQAGLSSGEIQPFSLADLGLSAEEIAALGLGESPAAAQEETPQHEPEVFEIPAEPVVEVDAAPFESSFDAEPVSLPSQQELPTQNEGLIADDLKPFSLSDLGLSDDEIAALGINNIDAHDKSLDLTEDELAGLDISDMTWAQPEPPAPVAEPDVPRSFAEPDEPTTDRDPVANRLLDLGRRQGYIDIADIIASVEDPGAEAERIESIGQQLHEANIQIRDGDEIIDMDAEYDSDDAASDDLFGTTTFAVPDPDPTPEQPMQPFSLSELGLSEEEIASLGLQELGSPSRDEPTMQPFSLSELGLSDEEIASLGFGESDHFGATADDEPTMQPFSLSELGLSDEEINSLTLDDQSASQPVEQTSDEPTMQPFSLSELGLSDEEIATLGLDTPEAPTQESKPATAPLPAIEEPSAPAQPVAETPAPSPASSAVRPSTAPAPATTTASPVLEPYMQRLEQEPENHPMRLALARLSARTGSIEIAVQQYKYLIRRNVLLDDVVDDVSDLIADEDDKRMLQRLQRVLGDAYAKQGRLEEALDAYNWAITGSH